jgi:hypothetical protein
MRVRQALRCGRCIESEARFEWARDHLDDYSLGGDVLDMLRERTA